MGHYFLATQYHVWQIYKKALRIHSLTMLDMYNDETVTDNWTNVEYKTYISHTYCIILTVKHVTKILKLEE